MQLASGRVDGTSLQGTTATIVMNSRHRWQWKLNIISSCPSESLGEVLGSKAAFAQERDSVGRAPEGKPFVKQAVFVSFAQN